MKLATSSAVPVYTIAGEGTARPLPEWLARKRKRSLKQDSEYANRVELLQDFEFEEASQCVRVSEDGDWVVSTGTYKPQLHTHYLPHLSLSYARHTNTTNQTFVLLSSDYSKSLHLQTDRSLEFHTPSGLHYTARIPRYGRDLKFNKRTAEALIPAVGVNADGNGEVFRLNLELGRFMKGYEVDVGGDDMTSLGGGALQGGIRAGAVNCAAVAEESHGLLAFGTSLGTVEFWDQRSRNRVSALGPPAASSSISVLDTGQALRPEITALDFRPSGLNLATGDSNGMIYTYDLRSPVPLLRKDQGYGSAIQTLQYLNPSSSSSISSDKLLSSDKKSIKIFSMSTEDLWTAIEPAVDLHHVAWVPDSGMLLTANEGRQQHAFFVPQLGPAPRWCAFLDNLVEEMAEDVSLDPNASSTIATKRAGVGAGEVYDNYQFVSQEELVDLNIDHLLGSTKHTNILRPYMHGFFVPQRLYEQAKLLANPDMGLQQREKSIREKIEKERESRIRGGDKRKEIKVKVNKRLAEKLAGREEANERRKAERILRKQQRLEDEGGDDFAVEETTNATTNAGKPETKKATTDLMADDRFKRLFEDEDFEIDEQSREFAVLNPSTSAVAGSGVNGALQKGRGLTAVEEEDINRIGGRNSSDSDVDEDDDEEAEEGAALRALQRRRTQNSDDNERDRGRIGSASYHKSGHRSQRVREKGLQQKAGPRMQVSSTSAKSAPRQSKEGRSFGDLAARLPTSSTSRGVADVAGGLGGEKQVTFAPAAGNKGGHKRHGQMTGAHGGEREPRKGGGGQRDRKERRSASGNVFRRM